MITLYDADRCPYCARVRIVLAEKGVEYETVQIDLGNRPDWIYEKNPLGKVPVLEEDTFVLPESEMIMEYLEERYPEPALLPADAAERALVRLVVYRFDVNLGDAYYARLQAQLEKITGKRIVVDKRTDPALVAGVVTRIGDRIFDGSLKTRLESLRDALLPQA